jgi:DHA2 family multidrug resistance protein
MANPTPENPPAATANRATITACAMAATLMQSLDSTIANVALPYMQGSLSASYDEITWVLTSYIVAAAIMTAPVGWLSARFGEKRLYLISIIGFTIASMACGIASSLDEMVLFRLLQGTFGAALVPLSQGTMLNIYPVAQRGAAMALWGMGVMIGPILGPTLGGYLTELYNWRYVFYVNLPFGIAATLGLWLFLPGTTSQSKLRFDWFGFTALATGIAGMQLMLDRGEIKDWFGSTEIIIEAVTALAGFYLFGVHMLTGERRVITPSMFRNLNYVTGMVITFVIGMVLLASTALMAPWLQELGGYPVEVAGLLLAPRGIGTLLAMVAAGWLSNRVDARLLMALGVGLMSFSLLRLSGWTPAINETSLFFNTMLQGAGMGLVFVPLNVLAFATLPAHLRYEGTALIALARNFGSSIGISVFEALLTRNTIVEHAALAPFGSPLNRALTVTQAVSHAFLPTSPYGAARFDHLMTVQAQVIAYNNDYRLMGLTALPILLLLPLLRPPPLVTKI